MGNFFKAIYKDRVSYLFILPFVLIFFVFTVLPVLISMGLSFTHFNMLEAPVFVGVDNYLRLFFNDPVFIQSIRNTLIFALIIGPVGYMLSLFVAWFINELRPKLRAVITLVFYAPSISGNVFLIWAVMFSGDSQGYINGFLIRNHFIESPIQFLNNPAYMMPVAILVLLWLSLGVGFLAFIAGLQGIDRTYYEASAVDGIQNRWQELWYVTLPLMKPMLMFGAVMNIAGTFSIGPQITALIPGFPSTDYAVHTIMHHLDDYGGMRFEMGYASAIATLLFAMMIGANYLVKNLIKKVGD